MSLPILRIDGPRAYPPRSSAFTHTFWEALGQGRWITTCCRECGQQTFPPKSVCPHCWTPDPPWNDLESRGELYSWTRVHAAPTAFAGEAPYALGIVDLRSGLRIACRLVEPEDGVIAIGNQVEMVVLRYDDGPMFAARVLR
jgi:uncharacterized OB-fold protein